MISETSCTRFSARGACDEPAAAAGSRRRASPSPCWRFSRRARVRSWPMVKPPVCVDDRAASAAVRWLTSTMRSKSSRRSRRGGCVPTECRPARRGCGSRVARPTFRARRSRRRRRQHLRACRRSRMFRPVGLGHVKAMLVASAVLPIDGPAGEDDQVGGLQPAQLLVEIGEAGGDARQAAVALIGLRGHVDGIGQRAGENGSKPLPYLPDLGQLVELLLGTLDLHRAARRSIGVSKASLTTSSPMPMSWRRRWRGRRWRGRNPRR